MSARKSPPKRTIWRRIGNVRFAETGWWCAQSYTNRSPCYLANIRVIFGKNSERITKSPRSARRPVVFHFLGKFGNREKQRASIGENRETGLRIQVRKARNSFSCRMSAINVGFRGQSGQMRSSRPGLSLTPYRKSAPGNGAPDRVQFRSSIGAGYQTFIGGMGSDASRVDRAVRGDVVDLAARKTDVH